MTTQSALKIAVTPIVGDRTWTEQALCSGKTSLFFEPPGERRGRRLQRETKARSYCALCPVSQECRTSGRENRENGIWGGENDEERALAGFPPRSIFRRSVAEARVAGLAHAAEREDASIVDE